MLGLNNPIHIVFILVLLLLVFGAKRLPELGRSLGSGLRGFKDSIGGEETPSTLSTPPSSNHVEALSPVPAAVTPERIPAQPAA